MKGYGTVRWERLSWIDVKQALNESHTIMLPVGSVEQHGPLLPLGLDTYVADAVCERACRILTAEGVRALKLPPLWFGLSSMWMSFKGTVTITSRTLYNLVKDILTSLTRSRVRHVTIVNGHAGNNDVLKVVGRDAAEEHPGLRVVLVNVWEVAGDVIKEVFRTPFFHADEVETSVALYLGLCGGDPRSVRAEDVDRFRKHGWWHTLDLSVRPKAHLFTSESTRRVGEGSFGRPDLACGGKGGLLLDVMAERVAKVVKDTLDFNQ